MALPSFPQSSLPGLFKDIPGLGQLVEQKLEIEPRIVTLTAESEWRFEVAFDQPIQVQLKSGTAELFGTDLASHAYTFKGTKAAIRTWTGCALEITGEPSSGYVAQNPPSSTYGNIHSRLESMRAEARGTSKTAPRVLVVGPDNAGKTSLVKTLTAYALKCDSSPIMVNLDPKEGVLSVPGSLTATVLDSLLDIEHGWGSSPISGPTSIPVKTPLVHHFGLKNAKDCPKLYKALVSRLALAIEAKMAAVDELRRSGILVDSPGSIADGKYDIIQHIVSECNVNVILVLGSDKVSNDLQSLFKARGAQEVQIIAVQSSGCVNRDDDFMKQSCQAQIREYFFGYGETNLAPHTIQVNLSELATYCPVPNVGTSANFSGGGDEDDDLYEPPAATSNVLVKVAPSAKMQNALLAVTFAAADAPLDAIKDAAVMGYIYVVEIDEARQKAKILSPVGGSVPRKAMIWGSYPEDIVGLVI